MFKRYKLKKTIERIEYMERLFDEVSNAVAADGDRVLRDAAIKEKVKILTRYYDNGQWLKDYKCDERGELPPGLKRGILSEDGMYNLLCDIEQMASEDAIQYDEE